MSSNQSLDSPGNCNELNLALDNFYTGFSNTCVLSSDTMRHKLHFLHRSCFHPFLVTSILHNS
jgi:hypothetical protein